VKRRKKKPIISNTGESSRFVVPPFFGKEIFSKIN
jgi:hypothetical protein